MWGGLRHGALVNPRVNVTPTGVGWAGGTPLNRPVVGLLPPRVWGRYTPGRMGRSTTLCYPHGCGECAVNATYAGTGAPITPTGVGRIHALPAPCTKHIPVTPTRVGNSTLTGPAPRPLTVTPTCMGRPVRRRQASVILPSAFQDQRLFHGQFPRGAVARVCRRPLPVGYQ